MGVGGWLLGRKDRLLACTLPIRLPHGWGVTTLPVSDLRRSGLRLRLRLADLGLSPNLTIPRVTEAVAWSLGEATAGELRGRRPEAPIRKALRHLRAGGIQRIGDELAIDLVFEQDLTRDEESVLGVTVRDEEPAADAAPVGDPTGAAEPAAEAALAPVPATPARVYRRRRGTERVVCRLGVRIHTARCLLEAQAQDLSETGLRLRLRLEDLDAPPKIGLFELAQVVNQVLGEVCAAELKPERRGSSLVKPLRLVRVGTVSTGTGEVDLGFRFESPLTADDIRLLGVALPADSSAA